MSNKTLLAYKNFDAVNIRKANSVCKRHNAEDKLYYILFDFGKNDGVWWDFKHDVLKRNSIYDYIIEKYSIIQINDNDLADATINNIDELT